MGRAPAVPVRLRRAAARPSSTSSRRSCATPTPRSRSRVTYEPGRAALAGSATTVELLKPLAREHVIARAALRALRARAPAARCTTSSAGCSSRRRRRVPPNGAVRLLEAGGERAEAELVGASVLELLRDGMAPGGHRGARARPRRQRALRPGLRDLRHPGRPRAPHAVRPHPPRRGRARLRPRRARRGTAKDVVTWLRTPGKLSRRARRRGRRRQRRRGPTRRDRLEVAVRRARGAHGARRALPLGASSAGASSSSSTRSRAAEGVEPFLAALLAEAEAIWTAPHVRRGATCSSPTPRPTPAPPASCGARSRELHAPRTSRTRRSRASRTELLEALGGDRGARERARRRRRARRPARRPAGDPRAPLPRGARLRPAGGRAAAAARSPSRSWTTARAPRWRSPPGSCSPRHEDTLPRERSLFYACVSRPEEALFLSFRSSDEEGGPQQPSPFLDDVRALFTDELWEGRGRRLLAEVTWPPAEAPTPHELRRAQAAGGEAPPPAAARRARRPGGPRAARRPRPRVRARPGDVRRLPGQVADRARAQARPGRPRPGGDAPRLARPRRARAHAARPARPRTGSARLTPGDARRRRWRSCARAIDELLRRRRARRPPRPPRARWRSTSSATSATRPRPARATSPTQLEWSFDDAA